MSSEDSSNRAGSGNAFEGDFLDPSSPRGRQIPEFSWTKSSQLDLAFRGREVAKESSKPEGEQRDNEASSSDQVEWSYAYNTSTLTLLEALKLSDWYGM